MARTALASAGARVCSIEEAPAMLEFCPIVGGIAEPGAR